MKLLRQTEGDKQNERSGKLSNRDLGRLSDDVLTQLLEARLSITLKCFINCEQGGEQVSSL